MRFIYLYAFLIALDLVAVAQRNGATPTLEYIAKPLLMLSLVIYFWQNTEGGKKRFFVLNALAFSWLGDVFLMFDGYFIFGLAAFLVAHIFYILTFNLDHSLKNAFRSNLLLPNLLILAYGISLLTYLFPHLPSELKMPVSAYATTILVMLVAALSRIDFVAKPSGQMVMFGAVLFVLSDSMIAVSSFVAPFTLSGFAIMLTYAVGQYLIVKGLMMDK
jgi:uncharacterized membrane protein YhhN